MSRSSSSSHRRTSSPSSPRPEMGFKKSFSMDFGGSTSNPWHNRRIQRLACFALISVLIMGIGLYHRNKLYPPTLEFQLDSISGLHKSNGNMQTKPKLPFISVADRRPTEPPFLTIPETTYEVPKVPIDPSLIALDHTRVALLIETRPLPHLPSLLLHFISVLPLEWTIRFMGSVPALTLIESSQALQMYIRTGKLLLIDIPEGLPLTTQQGLSEVFTSIEFYRDILAPAEWLLVFQSDSIICAASDTSLNDWVDMGYAWVGAPWNIGNSFGGNGGLSLRHIPSIMDLLSDPNVKQREKNDERFEDRWLSDNLGPRPGINMPNGEISSHFSVEAVWSEKPLGYHLRGSGAFLDDGIWRNVIRRKQIFSYCPEVKILLQNLDLKGY